MQAAWKAQMACLRPKYFDALPYSIARAKAEAEARRAALQEEIGASWCMHIGSCPEGPVHPTQFSQQPDGEVLYFGLDCVFKLLLPKWACACCKQSFSPHALDFGCFPSTPSTAHVWYDLKVLQQYKQLGLGSGLSATGGWA